MKRWMAGMMVLGWVALVTLGTQTAVQAAVQVMNVSISPRVILEIYHAYQENQKAMPALSPWVFLLSVNSDRVAASFEFDVEIRDGDKLVGMSTFRTTEPLRVGANQYNAGQITTANGAVFTFNENYISIKNLASVTSGQTPIRGDFSVVVTPKNVPGQPYAVRYALFAPPSAQNFPPMLVYPNNIEISSLIPVFSWTPGQGAVGYEVVLSLDPNPTVNPVWNSERIQGTQMVYPIGARALENNKKYYWEVKAFDSFDRPVGGIAGASQPAWFSINGSTHSTAVITPAEVEAALKVGISDKTVFEQLADYTPINVETNCPDAADLVRQLRDGSAKVTAYELE